MRNFIFLIGIFMPGFLLSQQIEKHISYGGENIGFYEYKPASYQTDPSEKFPLIIFLHGIGERGNGTSDLWKVKRIAIPGYIDKGNPMRFYKDGKWHSFIVLSPQCDMKYGMWPTLYVDALIEYAEKNLRIDKNRIYLTGLSMGGGGAWKYVSESLKNANKIAAVATVCAPATITNGCNIAQAKLPMWSFHATNDPTVNVSVITSMLDKILACNPAIKPIKTIWTSGGHEIWDKAYDTEHNYQSPNVFEWFLGYSRNNSQEGPDSGPVARPPDNIKPVANAGADRGVKSSYNITLLNGTLSKDPDGWLSSYVWRQISGPNTATLSNVSVGQMHAKNLIEGTYVFRITVTDNKGATDEADVKVYVNKNGTMGSGGSTNNSNSGSGPGLTPVQGANQLIHLPNNSVLLNGTLSYDHSSYIASFQWSKVSGPAAGTIASPNAGVTKVNGLVEGTYIFRLTVKNGKGASAFADVKVKVNAPPKVNAGSNVTITLPVNSALLNGTKSADPNGWIQSFLWTKVAGPASYTIASPNRGDTRINNLSVGTYTFRLTAVDGDGASAFSDVLIKVNPAPFRYSSTLAVTADEPVLSGTGVTLSAHPNPATSTLNITCNSVENGRAGLTIHDISGKPVKTIAFTKDRQVFTRQVNVSALNKGVYLLSLNVEGKQLSTVKFVKQ